MTQPVLTPSDYDKGELMLYLVQTLQGQQLTPEAIAGIVEKYMNDKHEQAKKSDQHGKTRRISRIIPAS